jgi:hypothetical protein
MRISATVVGGFLALLALALAACAAPRTTKQPDTPPQAASVQESDSNVAARSWRVRRGPFFERTWGIDIVGVRLIASGWMLQLKYRVIDPDKARGLLDRDAKPYLVDELSGAKLAVPAMENVGDLRQASAPDSGKTYFIIFGNASKIVRRGNPVDIEIGAFRAEGLVVE